MKGRESLKAKVDLDKPGPGYYNQTAKIIGTDGPKFSLRPKSKSRATDLSPGPGQYEDTSY